MADLPNRTVLENANVDCGTLSQVMEGEANTKVTSRLGRQYWTLATIDFKVNAVETLATQAIQSIDAKVAGGYFKTYVTLADANADIANIPLNVTVKTTDSGDYYKASSSASSLTKSPYDPLTQAKSYANEKTDFWQVQDINIKPFDSWSPYSVGFLGSNGKMPLWVWKSGVVGADELKVNNLETSEHNISGTVIKPLDPFTGFSFGIGGNDKYPFLVKNSGVVVIPELESENIKKAIEEATPSAVHKNCIQEWWISPVHTYLDYPYPRVVSGVYSETGEVIISEYVLGTGTTKQFAIDSTPQVDDHNAPSLWVKKGRRSFATWTQHGLTNNIEIKVSDKYGDISSLEYASKQLINAGSGGVTYTQIHHIESLSDVNQDTFYMLSRITLNAWHLIKLSINQETGIVSTLSNQKILSASEQYYCSSSLDSESNIIRVASGYNPAASANEIHYWEIDLTSGDIKDHTNTVRANFKTPSNLPIVPTTVPALLPQAASGSDRRLHYVRPAPMAGAIAYAEWTSSSRDSATYRIITKGGIIRDVAESGRPFSPSSSQWSYIDGISFPNPCYKDDVFITRYDNEKNQGVLERATLVNDEYVKKETLRVDRNHFLRPMNPVNGGDICMFTQLYEYGTTSTFSFVSDVKSIFLK